MSDALLKQPATLDEFLAWEERQPERWEFVGGVVRMMAGGTGNHDQIAINIAAALRSRLRGSGCFVHGSNLKVFSHYTNITSYPDVFVRCGIAAGRETVVDDPVVVFEVLSDSTMMHDLLRKRLAYKKIPALRVIVYVSQDQPRIDIVRRGADGRWDDDEPVEGLDGALALPEIGVTLPLAEVYEDVSFEPQPD